MSVRVIHCARVLFPYGSMRKFTTNSNKNIQFGMFALWNLDNYKVTHLLK